MYIQVLFLLLLPQSYVCRLIISGRDRDQVSLQGEALSAFTEGAGTSGEIPKNLTLFHWKKTHCIRCIWGWLSRVPSQGYHHFPYDCCFDMCVFTAGCNDNPCQCLPGPWILSLFHSFFQIAYDSILILIQQHRSGFAELILSNESDISLSSLSANPINITYHLHCKHLRRGTTPRCSSGIQAKGTDHQPRGWWPLA